MFDSFSRLVLRFHVIYISPKHSSSFLTVYHNAKTLHTPRKHTLNEYLRLHLADPLFRVVLLQSYTHYLQLQFHRNWLYAFLQYSLLICIALWSLSIFFVSVNTHWATEHMLLHPYTTLLLYIPLWFIVYCS